jgi:excinuclease ABC subunit B
MDETLRRRSLQEEYNRKNGITPETIRKKISDVLHSIYEQDYVTVPGRGEDYIPPDEIPKLIERLRRDMIATAKRLEFEEAAKLRDRIGALEARRVGL